MRWSEAIAAVRTDASASGVDFAREDFECARVAPGPSKGVECGGAGDGILGGLEKRGNRREEEPAQVDVTACRWCREVAHAEQQFDDVSLVLERDLPGVIRLAVCDHEGAVRATKHERRARPSRRLSE